LISHILLLLFHRNVPIHTVKDVNKKIQVEEEDEVQDVIVEINETKSNKRLHYVIDDNSSVENETKKDQNFL
jgi:hypothetical protein